MSDLDELRERVYRALGGESAPGASAALATEEGRALGAAIEALAARLGALTAAAADQRAIFEGAPVCVVVCDPGGRIVRLNRPAARLLGPGVTGAPLDEVLSDLTEDGRPVSIHGPLGAPVHLRLLDGAARPREVEVHVQPLPSGDRLAFLLDAPAPAIPTEAPRGEVEARLRFLESFSHEVRTPLHAIIATTATLAAIPGHEADLGTLGACARHLLALVERTVDFTRLEADAGVVQPGEADLGEALSAAVAIARVSLRPGQTLIADLDAVGGQMARVDALRLRQLVLHLLAAGAGPGATLHLGIHARMAPGTTPSTLEVAVRATPPAATPGWDGGAEITRARRLTSDLGGQLTHPEPDLILARLPIALVSRPTARVADAVPAALRVLVVDDQALNRLVAGRMLSAVGCAVDEASGGAEAVDRARAGLGSLHLVLMDCLMPEVDGLEATRRIRAFADHDALPIVALTASGLPTQRAECFAAGMNGFVAKPMTLPTLQEVLALYARRPRMVA